ncbi:hypothetical protein E2C01_063298 [Portunus trituberculatus]|uniref:Uncharacterized protein n=1 Tax=Portunus trituberculatus TaxID=210409 RepID=A0A5B7HDA7_PORTR|nr:hypothetical protein [Portunus trituberculatus]
MVRYTTLHASWQLVRQRVVSGEPRHCRASLILERWVTLPQWMIGCTSKQYRRLPHLPHDEEIRDVKLSRGRLTTRTRYPQPARAPTQHIAHIRHTAATA